eukprot:TRINITY_DN21176_c0_g1_i1.p1 TRINITY_DN21176_c0_g1~~TRINITY_DN21176_c0_g1_i1.p1  ORF type:complete len:330 (+),score=30.02 TRINITY_DN21176_c0_g1_i1:77-1066(+)
MISSLLSCIALGVIAVDATVPFHQPASLQSSHLHINPHPWPIVSSLNTTSIVFWAMQGESPDKKPVKPQWDIGEYTDIHNVSWSGGIAPYSGVGPRCPPSHNTASSVQWADAGVAGENAVYGAFLDTICNPAVSGAKLSTIVISYNWDVSAAARTNRPWLHPNGALRWRGVVTSPMAYRNSTSNACAVYSTSSFVLRHVQTGDELWYETSLFDFERPMRDAIFYDTAGTGLPIIHAAPRAGAGHPSRYILQAPGSADAMSDTSPTPHVLDFRVEARHVELALRDLNQKFKTQYPTNAAGWSFHHVNTELEGTSGVRGAITLQQWTVSME